MLVHMDEISINDDKNILISENKFDKIGTLYLYYCRNILDGCKTKGGEHH